MIEIREVKGRKEIKRFIEFPLDMYKNNPYFVPPLYGDEKKLFRKDYVYADQCDTVYYNAYRDGKIVGRISGILQKAANEKWGQKRVRFTRFDAIDDPEVAKALFDAVEAWAKEKGMEEVVGPLGFSDLEREGLLIDGFEWLSTFEEQYNFPYYQKLKEDLGYEKEVDWIERRMFPPEKVDERIIRISDRIMERYGLRIAKTKNTREFLRLYADKFFEILDTTYAEIYGTVPFTDKMKALMIDNFKLIIDQRFVQVIVDKDDRIVCFGLCFPAIGEALQKSGGRLTPAALVRLLKTVKHPKAIDLGLIGVLPEYRLKGVSAPLLACMTKMMIDEKVEYAETNLNLEDNNDIINLWKNFESIQHKRRRSYVKKLS